jgi:Ca-activated chloride channel family protein
VISVYYFGLLAVALPVLSVGQIASPRPISTNLRVESDLVLINALVTDPRGRPVIGLDASHFHLFEDRREQTIKSCSSEDVPVSIGLVVDSSGSMGDKIELLKNAASQFVKAANPADEYFIVQFQARPRIAVPFTTDADRLLGFINGLEAGGSTALFDAIHLAANEMRRARYPRKAMLIVTDGMDNHSRNTERATKRLIAEVDFPMYGIDVWQPQRSGNRYAIQRQDPATLDTLLPPSGGRVFAVRDLKSLVATTELISEEIRYEYVLGYAPLIHQSDGKTHRVKVSLNPSIGRKFKISHRSGYQAPVQ